MRIWWDEKRNQKSWKYCEIYYIKTIETYCVSFKLQIKIPVSEELNKNRLMLLSNCDICGKKNF